MIRSLFSALGLLIRATLVLILIAGLVLVAFVAHKGSQPMRSPARFARPAGQAAARGR